MDRQVVEIIFQIIAFLFAISVHESAHAWSASYFGDDTARLLGRISLNPIRHIDPIGTVLMPVMAAVTGVPLLGWAKPTPVNPLRLRHRVRDNMLVAAAGPISNFMVAIAVVIVYKTLLLATGGNIAEDSLLYPLLLLLDMALTVNVILAVFNFLPIPPLDGSHILEGLLPDSLKDAYASLQQFSFLILIAVLMYADLSVVYRPILGFFYFLLLAGNSQFAL
ncbi:MAG: site-2 protease family protein [Acidobacteria bacterium]|nr:site-2 protease family protein [Acidobacteriota bacterium]